MRKGTKKITKCSEFAVSKKEVANFSFPPEVLRQGLLVDFPTGHQGEVDLRPQEIKDEHPDQRPYVLHAQENGLGLEESFLELT